MPFSWTNHCSQRDEIWSWGEKAVLSIQPKPKKTWNEGGINSLKESEDFGGTGGMDAGRKPQMSPTSLCFVTATMLVTEDGKLNKTQSLPKEASSLVGSLIMTYGVLISAPSWSGENISSFYEVSSGHLKTPCLPLQNLPQVKHPWLVWL